MPNISHFHLVNLCLPTQAFTVKVSIMINMNPELNISSHIIIMIFFLFFFFSSFVISYLFLVIHILLINWSRATRHQLLGIQKSRL